MLRPCLQESSNDLRVALSSWAVFHLTAKRRIFLISFWIFCLWPSAEDPWNRVAHFSRVPQHFFKLWKNGPPYLPCKLASSSLRILWTAATSIRLWTPKTSPEFWVFISQLWKRRVTSFCSNSILEGRKSGYFTFNTIPTCLGSKMSQIGISASTSAKSIESRISSRGRRWFESWTVAAAVLRI